MDIESLVCELYPPESQERVFKDIRFALEKYPYLVPEQSETVLSHHGNTEKALSLCGPVCVNHASTTYYIPIDLFIPSAYPDTPPICYIRPAKGTILVKSHKFMDTEGLCTSGIIQNWHPSSTFVQFIDSLTTIFGVEPPVREADAEELSASSYGSGENYRSNIQNNSPPTSYSEPNISRTEPQIIFDLNSIETPPSYSQNPQQTRKDQLEHKLKEKYSKFSAEANVSIDNLLRDGENLNKHSSRLDSHGSALRHDVERQNQCLSVFTEKIKGLHEWIDFETKEQTTRSVDEMLQCSNLDEQLLETVAEDAALEDCLFVLRQELHRNNIDFESFSKQIRTLGRKQFFSRALANKIHEQL